MKKQNVTPKEIQAARENLANLEATYKARHEGELRALPAQVGLGSIAELIEELKNLGPTTATKPAKAVKPAKKAKAVKPAKAAKKAKPAKAAKPAKKEKSDRSHRLTPAEKISLEADLKNNMPAKEAAEKYNVSVNSTYYLS